MKTLKTLISILLISTTVSLAGTNGKLVKAVYKDGKIIPSITLNTVEVSANKTTTTASKSLVSEKSFIQNKGNIVKAKMVNGELMPVIELAVADVVAVKKSVSNVNVMLNKTFSFFLSLMAKANLI